jgi:hypothetical protein
MYTKGQVIAGRIRPQNWRITMPYGVFQEENFQDACVKAGIKSDGVGKLSVAQAYQKVTPKGGTITGRFEDGALFQAGVGVDGNIFYLITRASRYAEAKVETPKVETPKTPKAETKMEKELLTPNSLEAKLVETLAPYIKPTLDKEEILKLIDARMEGRASRTLEIKYGKSTKKVDGQHENFDKLVRAVGIGKNVALVGEAGSGKTYGAVEAAKALDLTYYIQSFSNQTSKYDLLGMVTANGDYVRTPLREAYEKGGVLILDEFDAANPNVVLLMNNMLSGGEYLFPCGTQVNKNENFRVIACQNTYGYGANKTYGGRNAMDGSSLNRFVKIGWGYDLVLERQIAGDTIVTQVVQEIRANARNLAMNLIISPRQSIDANDLVEAGFTMDEALQMTIFEGLKEDQIKALKVGVSY